MGIVAEKLNIISESLYDRDFYTWTLEQSRLLRLGQLNSVDVKNLAEEIEDMGKREKRELTSRLRVLLVHLLKWKFQPEQRSGSWSSTTRTQRNAIADLLIDSPSLTTLVEETVFKVYPQAIKDAADETGLPVNELPSGNPFTQAEILDEDFLPVAVIVEKSTPSVKYRP
jgi:predicted DNA-binding ribbon-helix-helix protein